MWRRELIKNKLYSAALISLGALSIPIEYDATAFIFAMTVAEKKAMNLEIQRQLAEYDKKHATEIDALILWVLHSEFGFGEKRLRRFYDRFNKAIAELLERYVMEENDKVWLCTYLLKQYGIDLEKWREEGGEKSFDG